MARTFAVVYGDVLTDLKLEAMLKYHRAKGAAVTIAIAAARGLRDGGMVSMDTEGRVISFAEKALPVSAAGLFRNGGVYIMEKTIFNHIPGGTYSDFGYDILPELIRTATPVYGYRLGDDEYLIDIGEWERYRRANEDVETGKVKIPRPAGN